MNKTFPGFVELLLQFIDRFIGKYVHCCKFYIKIDEWFGEHERGIV
jgi:hypothetical protein